MSTKIERDANQKMREKLQKEEKRGEELKQKKE